MSNRGGDAKQSARYRIRNCPQQFLRPLLTNRHACRSGDDGGADDAGTWPQMRRQTASHAEADDARAAVHHCTGFGNCRGELRRQIAAVTAANDVHPRARGNAGFKSQTNNDDHVIPTPTRRSKYQGKAQSATPAVRPRRFTAAANPQGNSRAQRVRLTLGHDRRWSFALAGLSTGSKAQDREDHCGSNGDFLHNAPNFPLTWIVQSKTWTLQNKKDELAPLVQ